MPIALSVAAMLARSPNRKVAAAFLAASGAVPISIVERDGVGVIVTGKTSASGIAARWWLHRASDASRVASAARRLAGVAVRQPPRGREGGRARLHVVWQRDDAIEKGARADAAIRPADRWRFRASLPVVFPRCV